MAKGRSKGFAKCVCVRAWETGGEFFCAEAQGGGLRSGVRVMGRRGLPARIVRELVSRVSDKKHCIEIYKVCKRCGGRLH